jgi:PilZ domain
MSLAVEVKIDCGDEVFVARSQEIGAGGMSLVNADSLSVAQPVKLYFTLPSGRELKLDAVVWWKRNQRVGIRFDLRDPQCRLIQQWVEEQIKLARTPTV